MHVLTVFFFFRYGKLRVRRVRSSESGTGSKRNGSGNEKKERHSNRENKSAIMRSAASIEFWCDFQTLPICLKARFENHLTFNIEHMRAHLLQWDR